ncbi:MAG: thiolase domain-containing protein [Nitrospinota bacterium]|nr:MAG: thiolase domain-containing protein [Nitrospinota bacterium]
MHQVSIIGIGSTPFGKLEGMSIKELAVQACLEAIHDAGIEKKLLGAFYLGNFAAGSLAGQEALAPMVANALGLPNIPCTKVEGACASAGIALRHGYLLIATGQCDFVLVAGVEKMTAVDTARVTEALASAADAEMDGRAGLTFPGVFAMAMQRHMYEYGTTREQVALVAVKNHENGLQNPMAQYRKPVTVQEVLESRLIADPLRLYDCCPISDGAAAVVLCAAERAREFSPKPVDIIGSGHAIGPGSLAETDDLTRFEVTVRAAREAYTMAELGPEDIDVVELHDCFTIAEIIDSEDLGFFPKGEGGRAVAEGKTRIDGTIPINPSGGLLSKGHPVGATGLGQVYEIVRQLRGEAPNQIKGAEIGLAHNLGGTGVVGTVHILRRR